MLQSAGFQDLGKTAVKIAAALGAGKAASEQLSGEAARHRAHRANLMGASVNQATAAQVLSSNLICILLFVLQACSISNTPPFLKKMEIHDTRQRARVQILHFENLRRL